MCEATVKFGKRPGNPLNRRVWKDLVSDWKRYLMIFLMLVVTIGFVSGMYVANNSMMTSLADNVEKLHQEDGHFEFSKKADSALLAFLESGEKADVVSIFRERAYEEAEENVVEAVWAHCPSSLSNWHDIDTLLFVNLDFPVVFWHSRNDVFSAYSPIFTDRRVFYP